MSIFDSPDDEDYLGWRREAACRGHDPEKFFPDRGQPATDALRVCRGCPMRNTCLEQHLAEPFGVFGGLTEDQRHALRRAGRPVSLRKKRPAAGAAAVRITAEACGTTSGYFRHDRLKEAACQPCRDARAAYRRARNAALKAGEAA